MLNLKVEMKRPKYQKGINLKNKMSISLKLAGYKYCLNIWYGTVTRVLFGKVFCFSKGGW